MRAGGGAGGLGRTPDTARRLRRCVLAGAAAANVLGGNLCRPMAAAAQVSWRVLPERALLPHLPASPRAPRTVAKLVAVTRSPSRFGEIIEGEAALGVAVPAVVLAGSGPADALVVGLEAGVFARFNMQTEQRELIASDWVFGVPFVLHRTPHWFRLRYYHISSHLGDEYLERFEVRRIPYSRDAVDAIAAVHLVGPLSVYGGGRWAFRVDPPNSARLGVRLGAHVEGRATHQLARPYLAIDLDLDQDNGWRPGVNLQAGVRVLPARPRPAVRVVGEFFTGPSPLGQFSRDHTTFIAFGVSIDL